MNRSAWVKFRSRVVPFVLATTLLSMGAAQPAAAEPAALELIASDSEMVVSGDESAEVSVASASAADVPEFEPALASELAATLEPEPETLAEAELQLESIAQPDPELRPASELASELTVHSGVGAGQFAPGQTVEINAIVKPGFRFTGWSASDGQIADPSSPNTYFTMPDAAATVTANYEREFEVITSGYAKYVLTPEGEVWTWGSSAYCELGAKDTPAIATWGQRQLQQIVGGYYGMFSLDNNSQVWACGSNSDGQLGNGSITPSKIPTQPQNVWGEVPITQIATDKSGHHILALAADNSLWAWGNNAYGTLGDGTKASRTTPVKVSATWGDREIVQIVAGNYSSYALTSDGGVWVWGSANLSVTPVQVTSSFVGLNGARIVQLAAGENRSYALASDGSVWLRKEYGNYKQITSSWDAPVVSISSGVRSAYALTADGAVLAFGENRTGELGNGSIADSETLVQVVPSWGSAKAVSVTGGWFNAYAVLDDGTVWAWGENAGLGDGTSTHRLNPVRIEFKRPHSITVVGGNTSPMITQAQPGERVKILADRYDGFTGWTSVPAIPFESQTYYTSFIMPDEPVVITAEYRYWISTVGDYSIVASADMTEARPGDTVKVQADVPVGLRFTGWEGTYTSWAGEQAQVQFADASKLSTYFLMPQARDRVWIHATAEMIRYPVTVIGGILNLGGDGDNKFIPGNGVSITATVPAGMEFVKWISEPPVEFVGWCPLEHCSNFAMPAEPVTLTAQFRPVGPVIPEFVAPSKDFGAWARHGSAVAEIPAPLSEFGELRLDGVAVPVTRLPAPGMPASDGEYGVTATEMPDGGTRLALHHDYLKVLERQTEHTFTAVFNGGWPEVTLSLTPAAGFNDVEHTSKFHEHMHWMLDSGLANGWEVTGTEGTIVREYRPGNVMLRNSMAAFLFRISGETNTFVAPTKPTFADVPVGAPFYLEIEWMAARGISTGWELKDGNGKVVRREFRPGQPLTRESAATFLYRLSGDKHKLTGRMFADVTGADPQRRDIETAIEWMAAKGIATGSAQEYGLPKFNPGGGLQRDAMAAFIYRAVNEAGVISIR